MADIRKIISKCNIKRHGWMHDNLKSVNINKSDAEIAMYIDQDTGYALQSAVNGKLTDVVLMLVINAEEFNKYFNEEKQLMENKKAN